MANDKNAFYVAHVDALRLITLDLVPIEYHKTLGSLADEAAFLC